VARAGGAAEGRAVTSLWLLLAQGFPMRLRVEEVARALNMSRSLVEKQLSRETFPVPGYKEGATWYFDIRLVAQHLDEKAQILRVADDRVTAVDTPGAAR
jgi:hypothetical protein